MNVKLYASQADPVLEAIRRDGVCFSKEAYVRKKYGESAWIFLTAYRFFVKEAEAYVPRVADWNRILCMKYLPEDEADGQHFQEELAQCGLREDTVMRSSFYPEWKARIMESWKRLFRFHKEIAAGDLQDLAGIQAGLWQIREEWLAKVY